MRNFTICNSLTFNQGGDVLILNTYSEYKNWYLSRYDLSMFAPDEINALLEDEKPEGYPCIPYITENYDSICYFGLDLIKLLSVAVH